MLVDRLRVLDDRLATTALWGETGAHPVETNIMLAGMREWVVGGVWQFHQNGIAVFGCQVIELALGPSDLKQQ